MSDTKPDDVKDNNQTTDFPYIYGDMMGGFAPVPADQMGWTLWPTLAILAVVMVYLSFFTG